jgi:hypothetical protein
MHHGSYEDYSIYDSYAYDVVLVLVVVVVLVDQQHQQAWLVAEIMRYMILVVVRCVLLAAYAQYIWLIW